MYIGFLTIMLKLTIPFWHKKSPYGVGMASDAIPI